MNSNNENTKKENHFCGHGRRRCWKFPFIIAAIILIKSAVIMFLWNLLVPELFHGPELNYIHAIELTVLVKLLVGFGGHRHFRGPPPWIRGHFSKLSPEEREKLREEIRKRCDH